MRISRRTLAWSGLLADMRDLVRTWVVTGAMIVLAAICAPYAAGFGYGLALWRPTRLAVRCRRAIAVRPTAIGPSCWVMVATGVWRLTAWPQVSALTPENARDEGQGRSWGNGVAGRCAPGRCDRRNPRRFRDSAPACSPLHWDCRPEGLSSFWNGPIDRFFGRLGDSYQRFFGPAFYHGLGWAAAHISFIAWQGPLQRGSLNIAYAVVLVMASALATVALMERWHRQRGR